MTVLPETIDTTYVDRNPGDKTHQQHHDVVHAETHNPLNAVAAGDLVARDAGSRFVGVPVTAFMKSLFGDADAAAARTRLEVLSEAESNAAYRTEVSLGEFGDLGVTFHADLINAARAEIAGNGGGTLLLPPEDMVGGGYDLDTPIDMSGTGVSMRGVGKRAVQLRGIDCPALYLARTAPWIGGTLRNLRLSAVNATVIDASVLGGSITTGKLEDVYVKVETPGYHGFHFDGDTALNPYALIDMDFLGLHLEGKTLASRDGTEDPDVPLWYVRAAGTLYNSNLMQGWRTNHCKAPHLYFEARTAGSYLADNMLERINCEQTQDGGALRMFGCRGWGVEGLVVWDLTNPVGATQVIIGKNGSGAFSAHNEIARYVRHGGGTMPADIYDIQLQGGGGTIFTKLTSCGREASGGEPHVHDLGFTSTVVINPGNQDAYENHVTGGGVETASFFRHKDSHLAGTTRLQIAEYGSGGPSDRKGTGSPEGVVTAVVGSTFRRTDGGAGTSFYVKESGTGNTGWVAK